MASAVFLGAGSVVFTRGLLADIFGFPELAGSRIVLHAIDPERLETAEAIARRIADHPVGDYLRVSEDNLAEYAAVRRAVLAGEDLDIERETTEYAPQVIHSLETGTARRIVANVANRSFIAKPHGWVRRGSAVHSGHVWCDTAAGRWTSRRNTRRWSTRTPLRPSNWTTSGRCATN